MKLLTLSLILTSLLITGCESIEERPIIEKTQTISVLITRSYQTQKICAEKTQVAPGWKAIACTEPPTNQSPTCKIWVDPTVSDDILGHEFRHCLDGYWHQ